MAELEVAARAALGEAAAWRARYDDLARRAGGAAPATPLAPADRRVRHALLGMLGFQEWNMCYHTLLPPVVKCIMS